MKNALHTNWMPIALAGLCATLIGLGIGRFSYVAILPLMIDAQWTSASGAAQLAAANLVGYLIGAFVSHRLALLLGPSLVIRGAMVAVLISLLCCSINPGLAWLWFWRMIAGIAGGVLIIITGSALLKRIPVAVRGKTNGIIFSGVGVGTILSGLLVPAIGAERLEEVWLALAAIVVVMGLFAWPKFRDQETLPELPVSVPTRLLPQGPMLALVCAYILDGIGYLPHSVFWVEYLVHGLNKPIAVGGAFWMVFGMGAAIGPLFSGMVADHLGFRKTLVACFALKALAIAMPLMSTSMPSLFLSSFVVGALTPTMGALVSGRAAEIGGAANHQRNWAMLTFFYSGAQAGGGYAMAYLYATTHSFKILFILGASLLAMATAIALFNLKRAIPEGIPCK